MSDHPKVAIFWDYENCSPPCNSCGLGYDIVNNIGRVARLFGSVTIFRAYLNISAQSSKSVVLRSELQSSGVSVIDCPHNGRKDVVDKMILVDMLAFAIDHPVPATVILITGDRDYAYAVSTLKLRKYRVILVVPSSPHTPPSLEGQASLVIDWSAAALRTRTEAANSTQAVRQPYPELDADLVTKLLGELQDPLPDNPNTTIYPYSTPSRGAASLQRITARDLLEPSSHYKSTAGLGSTQEYTTPVSPKKPPSTGSDPAPGAPPIPKTPSRSRHASVSMGSTRARSMTIVGESPAMEQDTHLPPSATRQSGITDTTEGVGPAKRTSSALPSLDTLELPLHDSCPPSSIIVCSPLASSHSMLVPGKHTTPPSRRLNSLASPFVLTKDSTESESIPSYYSKQSHTTAKPTFPIVGPTNPLPGTVASVYETPHRGDIGVLNETNRVIDDDNTNHTLSILHPVPILASASGTTDTLKSKYHFGSVSYVARSPPGRNVWLPFSGTPSSKRVSPLDVDDGVDSRLAALSCTSNILGCHAPGFGSVLPSSTFPPTPFTTMQSYEHDSDGRRQMWTMFRPLIHLLSVAQERGVTRPSRSTIALALVQSDKLVYQRAGVSRFRDYTALAERAGIIELGGREASAWISLHPDWCGMDGLSTTHVLSNRVSSPMSDTLRATRNPLLTVPKTSPTQKTTIFQSPALAPLNFNSPEISDMLPISTDRQDSASPASIPAQFQPLIDILIRTRAEGFHQTLRSVVGQLLGQDIYAQAGVSGFKEYVHQASEAQLVQFGGVGGHAWIRLHPELRI